MTISNKNAKEIKKFINSFLQMKHDSEQEQSYAELRELYNYNDEKLSQISEQLSTQDGRDSFDAAEPLSDRGLTLLHLAAVTGMEKPAKSLMESGAKATALATPNHEKLKAISPLITVIVNYEDAESQDKEKYLKMFDSMVSHSNAEELITDKERGFNVYHDIAAVSLVKPLISAVRNSLKEKGEANEEQALACQKANVNEYDVAPIDLLVKYDNAAGIQGLLEERSGSQRMEIFRNSLMSEMYKNSLGEGREEFGLAMPKTSGVTAFVVQQEYLNSKDMFQEETKREVSRAIENAAKKQQQVNARIKREEEQKRADAAYEELIKQAEKEEKEKQEKQQSKSKKKKKSKKSNKESAIKIEADNDNNIEAKREEAEEQIVKKTKEKELEKVSDTKSFSKLEPPIEKSKPTSNWVEKVGKKNVKVIGSGQEAFKNMFDHEVGVKNYGSEMQEGDSDQLDSRGRNLYW